MSAVKMRNRTPKMHGFPSGLKQPQEQTPTPPVLFPSLIWRHAPVFRLEVKATPASLIREARGARLADKGTLGRFA